MGRGALSNGSLHGTVGTSVEGPFERKRRRGVMLTVILHGKSFVSLADMVQTEDECIRNKHARSREMIEF